MDEKDLQKVEQAKLVLQLTPAIYSRLASQAKFLGVSLEEHATKVLTESIDIAIGKPLITGPSFVSGQDVKKKVTGPSFMNR